MFLESSIPGLAMVYSELSFPTIFIFGMLLPVLVTAFFVFLLLSRLVKSRPMAFLISGFAIAAAPFIVIGIFFLCSLLFDSTGHDQDMGRVPAWIILVFFSSILGSSVGVIITTIRFWFFSLSERKDLEGVLGDFWRLGLTCFSILSILLSIVLIFLAGWALELSR